MKAFHCFSILTVCYLDDVIRNKVVINIADESNKDRSLNIVSPTEELLVPPENRLEIWTRLEHTFNYFLDPDEEAPLDPRGEI